MAVSSPRATPARPRLRRTCAARLAARLAALTLLALSCWLPAHADATLPPGLEPPVAVTRTAIDPPAEVTQLTGPLVVRVKVVVGRDGAVRRVQRVAPPNPPWDVTVMRAVAQWGFRPGRYHGKPVVVAVNFSHTFVPPPPPKKPENLGPERSCVLRGKIVEKGTRAPAGRVTVVATVTGGWGRKRFRVVTDVRGRFRLALPPGKVRVTLHGGGYLPFLQRETLAPDQGLAVAYYIQRERYDPYEIVVFGKKRRRELSRVTLRGAEIQQVPGTFGDPFRVVATLPGVSSIMSLLPLPVVRGASPGSTGFLIDGTRVPLLFHLLSGPSVIHPAFIDEVRFYPGGAPVLYGGYTAGIIDGRTRRARQGERMADVDVNFLQAGGLVRTPVPALGATLTVAGRVGYPGLILSLATNEASLSYWDYQVRLDGGNPRNGWTVFAFGAWDEVEGPVADADPNDPEPELEPVLQLGFHRLDLRAHHGRGKWDGRYRLVTGLDQTLSGDTEISKLVVEPTLRWTVRPLDTLEVVGGVEGLYHNTDLGQGSEVGNRVANQAETDPLIQGLTHITVATALVEALWRPTPRWLVRPGVRADWRYDGETALLAADPRVSARYRLGVLNVPGLSHAATATSDAELRQAERAGAETADDSRATWLKAGVGLFHQPPRMFLPLPGLDMLPLRSGLLAAIQSSVGLEIGLGDGFSVGVETYYNHMDPVVFDLEINPTSVVTEAQQQLLNPRASRPPTDTQDVLDRLLAAQRGRAMGLELMIRRQSRKGPYGWVAYTLSLSEREKSGSWVPYDFDRTHLLNVVAGLRLPRNWDLGLRLQYQTGKPATTTAGYNTARGAGFFRVDLRVDKRAVWNKWLFDFYIDVTNLALLPEEITPGATIRYVLPTVGVRARF